MKQKNRHIDKYFRDPLPDPEVPVDDAWTEMSGMLDAVPAGNTHTGNVGKWIAHVMKFKGVIAICLTAASVASVVIYKTLSPNSAISTVNISEKQATKPVTSSDSIAIFKNQENKVSNAGAKRSPATADVLISAQDSLVSAAPIAEVKIKYEEIEKTSPSRHVAASESHENRDRSLTSNPSRNLTSNPSRNLTRNPKGRSTQVNIKAGSGNQENGQLFTKSEGQRDLGKGPAAKNRNVGNTNSESNAISTEVSADQPKLFSVKIQRSLDAHFPAYRPDLKNKIVIRDFSKQAAKAPESTKTINRPVRFGLEWNVNSSLKTTDYVLTGADSINKFARLLIPGIFVSKSWGKHGATFTLSPYQSYFGNNQLIRHEVDSTVSTDSSKSYNNTRFIKAVGINFGLQYQYHLTPLFALNAGASYSIFSAALFRPQFQNWQGKLLDEKLSTLKPKEMATYINPRLFAIKAGISFTPGRFQTGFNIILPLSNVSKSSQFPAKALNGQVYLRVLVW